MVEDHAGSNEDENADGRRMGISELIEILKRYYDTTLPAAISEGLRERIDQGMRESVDSARLYELLVAEVIKRIDESSRGMDLYRMLINRLKKLQK